MISFRINDWTNKHVARKDIKSPTCFALSNKITESDKYQCLAHEEFRAFIHVLCVYSQANPASSEQVILSVEKACRLIGVGREAIARMFKKLSLLKVLEFEVVSDDLTQSDKNDAAARSDAVRMPFGSCSDDVQITSGSRAPTKKKQVTRKKSAQASLLDSEIPSASICINSERVERSEASGEVILLPKDNCDSAEMPERKGTEYTAASLESKDSRDLALEPPRRAGLQPAIFKTPIAQVWEAYSEAWLARWGVKPPYSAKNYSMCKFLIAQIGLEPALSVVKFYVSHPLTWYVSKAHPLELCLRDCQKLYAEMMTSRVIDDSKIAKYRKEATQERSAHISSLLANKDSIAQIEGSSEGDDAGD